MPHIANSLPHSLRTRIAHLALTAGIVTAAAGIVPLPSLDTVAEAAAYASPSTGGALAEASRSESRDTAATPSTVDAGVVGEPEPVGGLSKTQMRNAVTIVRVGEELGMSERARIIAVMTAMQESGLRNLANDNVSSSFDHEHQGSGSDHDSVGLFQQRASMGWGSVKQLMDPAYSAKAFYKKLKTVGGWTDLSLAGAAQAVQVSAFPDAYAKHESVARKVVDAV